MLLAAMPAPRRIVLVVRVRPDGTAFGTRPEIGALLVGAVLVGALLGGITPGAWPVLCRRLLGAQRAVDEPARPCLGVIACGAFLPTRAPILPIL